MRAAAAVDPAILMEANRTRLRNRTASPAACATARRSRNSGRSGDWRSALGNRCGLELLREFRLRARGRLHDGVVIRLEAGLGDKVCFEFRCGVCYGTSASSVANSSSLFKRGHFGDIGLGQVVGNGLVKLVVLVGLKQRDHHRGGGGASRERREAKLVFLDKVRVPRAPQGSARRPPRARAHHVERRDQATRPRGRQSALSRQDPCANGTRGTSGHALRASAE